MIWSFVSGEMPSPVATAKPSGEVTPTVHHWKGLTMPQPDSATLNVQPRRRQDVYEGLVKLDAGRSVKDMLGDLDVPETEFREILRKLDQAGRCDGEGALVGGPAEAATGATEPAAAESSDGDGEG